MSIFKSYDIRGIYPLELNEDIAYNIGKSFAINAKNEKIVVGRDGRISSPALFNALSDGIRSQGVDVYDIGQVPTECVYFTIGHYDFNAGIMITASHNPKEYNGFKTVKKENNFVKVIPGKDIGEMLEEDNSSNSGNKGKIIELDIWQDFLNHILSFADVSRIKPLKIVVDASNGVASKVMSLLKEKLPVEIIDLNFEIDGNFPNHAPNPLLEGSIDQISQKIKEKKADFGVIFDGDADRIYLIDETGEFVRADVTLTLLAKYFLEKNPGAAIVYNAVCSRAVPKFIKEWGGKAIRAKVGFINVQDELIKNNGVMGGELSGHYCFRDNFYVDSGFIVFLTLLQIISESDKKVSEITKELSPYAKASEINFEVENKDKIIENVRQKYADGKQDELDGLTVEYNNWWFNIRPSQTEPLLRFTIEADSLELLEEKKKELTKLITNN